MLSTKGCFRRGNQVCRLMSCLIEGMYSLSGSRTPGSRLYGDSFVPSERSTLGIETNTVSDPVCQGRCRTA